MIKYYKNGMSIYKLDLDTNEVTTITNHPFNKGIVYSFGMPEIAKSMDDSFSSQIGILRPGGLVTLETTDEEYNLYKQEVFNYFSSASISI